MLLEVRGLTHVYMRGTPFEVTALQETNLQIRQGSLTGIIGQTGSGKSTLVQHFNGLLQPTRGRVLFEGRDLWEDKSYLREVRRRVGLLFQYPEEQLFEDRVYDDVAFGIKALKLPAASEAARVRRALEQVNLDYEALRDRSPFSLSGGEKRRVAMAGVLVMRPDLLILDEPTAGLDPRGRREILTEIRDLHRQEKLTVIIVSHSMEDIAWLAQDLVVLEAGAVILTGTPEEVFAREERLKEAGLSVPEVNRVLKRLKEAGYPLNTGLYTVEEAEAEILKALGGKRCEPH
jgi:energy-coupling factor transport system ATP-binding protein